MRKFLAAAALTIAAILPPLVQAADQIRIGYWTSGVSLGYGAVLEAKDFLTRRGIEAQFVHFPDVNAPLRALAAGSIDLAFGAPLAGVFSTAAEGVPIRIFAATQPADVQFVVPADSPVRSLDQLKGKKIGMSPAGSSVAAIASAVLSGNHGIGSADFALVGGNESRLAQFLAQDQVDGAALRSVTIAQLDGELKLRPLTSFAEEWQALTQSTTVPYIGVGAASAKLVDANPDAVARVIAAMRDTLAWGKARPDEVVEILKQSANLPEKDARIYVGQWEAMNRVAFEPADLETLRRQHAVFVDGGLIKGELQDALFATEPYTRAKHIH